ncbi:MAG: hypothetical protein IKK05_06155 [Alistipes sp.]|nr:hypothetical protein [Alistipes sp.]
MKRVILIFALLLFGVSGSIAQQEEKIIKGFSGGMMIHSGYQFGCDNPFGYDMRGATFGIGGVARLHLSDHFRTGFEGYVSTLGLREDIAKGSHNKIFWTGLLADWYWQRGAFYPYVGLTVGGGMETAYLMFEGSGSDWRPESKAVFKKEGFVAVDPFVGCDMALSDAVRVTLKMDWLLAMRKSGLNSPTGPRLYIGFIFAH